MLQTFAYALSQIPTLGVPTGLYSSLCTIQQFPVNESNSLSSTGWPLKRDPAQWEDRAGMVDILCKAAPEYIDSMRGTGELKTPADVQDMNSLHVLLAGYYPTIEKGNRALVKFQPGEEYVEYDITGVDNDSQGATTRLRLEIYKV